jgi:hypothetical protein
MEGSIALKLLRHVFFTAIYYFYIFIFYLLFMSVSQIASPLSGNFYVLRDSINMG